MLDISWLLCRYLFCSLSSRPASKLQRRPCWALQLFGTGQWWCTLATLSMALSGAPFLTATLSLHAVHCVCCLGTDIQDLCRLGWTQKCWDPSSANPLARTACQSACTRARNLRELTAIVPWQTRCRKKFCCKGSLAWHMIFRWHLHLWCETKTMMRLLLCLPGWCEKALQRL